MAIAFICLTASGLYLVNKNPNAVRNYLEGKLIYVDSLPRQPADAMYVLGGSQSSLAQKFEKAAALYHEGLSEKVLILSRPGITEYSPTLDRNLTNDEWALLDLQKSGIPENHSEFIEMEKSFFGTFSEAKGIAAIASQRGYKNIILITSSYHTQRVALSFQHFLKNHDVSIYLQGSDEKVSLTELLLEFLKLTFYRYFLAT